MSSPQHQPCPLTCLSQAGGQAHRFPLPTWRGGSCLRGEGLGARTPEGGRGPDTQLPAGSPGRRRCGVHVDGKQGEVPGTGLLSQFASPPGRRGAALMRPPWF